MDIAERVAVIAGEFAAEVAELGSSPRAEQVESLRVSWLGRKGPVVKLYADLKGLSSEERPVAGQQVNTLRDQINSKVVELQGLAADRALQEDLERRLDVTLPCSDFSGSLHPVTLMEERLWRIFRGMGFSIYEGPELEQDFYNFSALNIPDEHPARDMQDTFFLTDKNYVLRTHTSNIQIHAMLQESPPLRLIAPGRVYRVDSDASHTPMFHQLEALVVDKHISFAHLKGMVAHLLAGVFGREVKTRFRPSYFPFVEPGAEVDLECTLCQGAGCRVCKQTGWLEIGGAGMVHPNVFEAVNYDSEVWTGYAFGFGIDRMAMLAYGLDDLRVLFSGDYRYLSAFPLSLSF